MSETGQQDRQEQGSPLHSERGTTKISSGIVDQIVDRAVRDVEGIRVDKVSTNVGQYEAAVDFKMKMEFGRDLPELTSQLRRRISDQVERMTGLRVTDQNIIVTDIFFPEGEVQGTEESQEPDEQEDQNQARAR